MRNIQRPSKKRDMRLLDKKKRQTSYGGVTRGIDKYTTAPFREWEGNALDLKKKLKSVCRYRLSVWIKNIHFQL